MPANLWFRNAPDGEMLREMKHTSDTFERVLSLLIVPCFGVTVDARWEEGWDDTYDWFIGGERQVVWGHLTIRSGHWYSRTPDDFSRTSGRPPRANSRLTLLLLHGCLYTLKGAAGFPVLM